MNDMQYGYASKKSVNVLNYEYRVPASKASAPPAGQAFGSVAVWQAQRYERPGASPAQFVSEIYAKAGKPALPTSLDAQIKVGSPVKKLEDLKEGDRVYFWDSKRDRLGDAGIYSGNGYFIHLTPAGVQSSYLGDKKWLAALVAARR